MKLWRVVSAQLASVLLVGRGSFRRRGLSRPAPPAELLELYSFEGCPWCRLVRERLNELDLDYIHRSCPKGDSPNRERLRERAGKVQVPYLVDPNTGAEMFESSAILAYLEEHYA